MDTFLYLCRVTAVLQECLLGKHRDPGTNALFEDCTSLTEHQGPLQLLDGYCLTTYIRHACLRPVIMRSSQLARGRKRDAISPGAW